MEGFEFLMPYEGENDAIKEEMTVKQLANLQLSPPPTPAGISVQ